MKIVKRAFALLSLLKHFEELPLKRIAAALGVGSNSAWNLLHFLCESGYVEKCGPGVYRLGPEFRSLAALEAGGQEEAVEEALSKLSASVKESSVAARLRAGRLEVVQGVNYEREIMVNNSIYGKDDALYLWASGHVLLAWQAEEVVEGVLSRDGLPKASQWPGVQTRSRLKAELARIREEGFAERLAKESNVYSIASPAQQGGGAVLAIGVSYPGFRNTPMHRQAILGNLRLAAKTLSGRLRKKPSS